MAREAPGNDKVVAVGFEFGDGFGAFGVVASERPHVVPQGKIGETTAEDASLEVLNFDGEDGLDSFEKVGKDSAAAPGEKVHRVFGLFHDIVDSSKWGAAWQGFAWLSRSDATPRPGGD